MAVLLRSIHQAASLESPTLGESKPVPITHPLNGHTCTVNQLRNHTGKKTHVHNVSKVSRFLFKSFYISRLQKQYCFSPMQILILNVTQQFRWSYFELGLPVRVVGKMSPVQENVFFSLFNFSCLDATVLKGRQFFFQKTVISCSSYF